jgi:hypothetical protein
MYIAPHQSESDRSKTRSKLSSTSFDTLKN